MSSASGGAGAAPQPPGGKGGGGKGGSGGGSKPKADAGGEDDDWLMPAEADKPGFVRWAEVLPSRTMQRVTNACVGAWLPGEKLVELTAIRGKKAAVMGFTRPGGAKGLYPEEALYLVDLGELLLLRTPGVAIRAPLPPSLACVVPGPGGEADDSGPQSTYLTFPEAYTLLAQHVHMPRYLVYAQLRAAGLVVARHRPLPGTPGAWGEATDAGTSSSSSGVERAASSAMIDDGDDSAVAAAPLATFFHYQNSSGGTWRGDGAAAAAAAASSSSAPTSEEEDITYLYLEGDDPAPLAPSFEVWARDGITSFRPSAPGPPDAYVIVVGARDPPPAASQLSELRHRLAAHMDAARASQLAKDARSGRSAGAPPPPPGCYVPVVKFGIVAHATVTFYGVTLTQLSLPRRNPRA